MALRITKLVPNGFECTYWKIGSATISWVQGKVRVLLAAYKDEATRKAGGEPAGSGDAVLTFSGGEPTRAVLYACLKADPAFAGAEDC